MARPPGSRLRNYDIEPATNENGPRSVEPHSPWQLLVENQREKLKITIRELSARARIPSGTLFNWVRSKRGHPLRAFYTQDVNKRLAESLKLSEETLADAYNKSAFNPVDPKVIESPRPAPQSVKEIPTAYTVDGLKRVLSMLKLSGRTTFTLAEIELTAALVLGPETDPNVKPLDGDKTA